MIGVELSKQIHRARGWATMAVMAVVAVVLCLVIGVSKPSIAERIGDWGSVTADGSGYALPVIVLNAMLIFLFPLAVAVFAGEPVAGEAAWGSLRYLLARPVARWRVLLSKAAVAAAFSVAAVLVAVLVALVAGVIAFGWRPLTVLDLQHTTPFHIAIATFSPWQALGRLALATGFVMTTLTSTFAFALMLSTFTARAFSAVAGGVGLSLFSRALDNVPGLHALGSWLPVTDGGTSLWTGFFDVPFEGAGVGHELLVQAVYSVVFLGIAAVWFTRSDILT